MDKKHYERVINDWYNENVNVDGEMETINLIEFAETSNIIVVISRSKNCCTAVCRIFKVVDCFTVQCEYVVNY